MNKSLSRSIGFWLLLVVSLATTAVGGWLISGQIATMTTTLLDGTATGVEVYVGQSLVVVGAGVLAAGIVGILLTLGLVAARSLVPTPAPAVVEAIDWTTAPTEDQTAVAAPTSTSGAPLADTGDTVTDAPLTPADDHSSSADSSAADSSEDDSSSEQPLTR
ncbi:MULTISPECIES: hypothetical protein [unclassified Microbacterium]|uniref:hypothetical protein n=1 Tax=unclassified Microbacterium TaxID=2609290 RepID=UPI001FCE968A|nr:MULTISPECIES: hypothetical protein [unclassified Microbacterium]